VIAGDRSSRRGRDWRILMSVRATWNRIGPEVPSKTSRMMRLGISRPPCAFTTGPLCIHDIIDLIRPRAIRQTGGWHPYFRVNAGWRPLLVLAVGTLDDVRDDRQILLRVCEAEQPRLFRRSPEESK
jgi:hypothetical protein